MDEKEDESFNESEVLHLNGFSRRFVMDFYKLMGKFASHVEISKTKDAQLDQATTDVKGLDKEVSELRTSTQVIETRLDQLKESDNLIIGLLISLFIAFIGAVLYLVFSPK